MRSVAIATAFAALVVATPALAANSGPYFGVGVTHDNVATGGDLEGAGINGIGGTVWRIRQRPRQIRFDRNYPQSRKGS